MNLQIQVIGNSSTSASVREVYIGLVYFWANFFLQQLLKCELPQRLSLPGELSGHVQWSPHDRQKLWDSLGDGPGSYLPSSMIPVIYIWISVWIMVQVQIFLMYSVVFEVFFVFTTTAPSPHPQWENHSNIYWDSTPSFWSSFPVSQDHLI